MRRVCYNAVMKLSNLQAAPAEMSGIGERSHGFAIHDPSLIFTILRSSMYSNPRYAAIKEYLCNARDANREVGLRRRPVRLFIPEYYDYDESPFIGIADDGPGIQPWDIRDLFVVYGASTKRGTDRLTGGYGLGCKTGFAIGDSFHVISTTPDIPGPAGEEPLGDDPRRLVRRTWLAFLGDDNLGSMTLVSEHLLKGSGGRGVEVRLPVPQDDLDEYADLAARAMRFWPVRATCTGRPLEYADPDVAFRGSGWFAARREPGGAHAIVDGMAFPIDRSALEGAGLPAAARAIDKSMYLHFGNGVITPTPNREAIIMDEAAVDAIAARLDAAAGEIRARAAAEIGDLESLCGARYLEACDRARRWHDDIGLEWLGYSNNTAAVASVVYVPTDERHEVKVWRKLRGDKMASVNSVRVSSRFVTLTMPPGMARPNPARMDAVLAAHPDADGAYCVRVADGHRPSVGGFLDTLPLDRVATGSIMDFAPARRQGPSKKATRHKVLHDARQPGCAPNWRRADPDLLRTGGGIYAIIGCGGTVFTRVGGQKLGRARATNLHCYDKHTSSAVTRAHAYATAVARLFYGNRQKLHGVLERYAGQVGPGWMPVEEWARVRLRRIAGRYPHAFKGLHLVGWTPTEYVIERYFGDPEVPMDSIPPSCRRWAAFLRAGAYPDREMVRALSILGGEGGVRVQDPELPTYLIPLADVRFRTTRQFVATMRALRRTHATEEREREQERARAEASAQHERDLADLAMAACSAAAALDQVTYTARDDAA